jgi:hypothetical protein
MSEGNFHYNTFLRFLKEEENFNYPALFSTGAFL